MKGNVAGNPSRVCHACVSEVCRTTSDLAHDGFDVVAVKVERSEGEATEVYEAQCRAWADRAGVAIDEVVEETDVSGSLFRARAEAVMT